MESSPDRQEPVLCSKCGARTVLNESASMEFMYGHGEVCMIHHLPTHECPKCRAVYPAPGVGRMLSRLKEAIRQGHFRAYSFADFIKEQKKK